MPCDTRLKANQTIQQRADEVRRAVGRIQARLIDGRAKVVIGPQGAVAFTGIVDAERDGVTDACAYRRIMATGSALARAQIAKAEQLSGRSINRQVVGQGAHSHDGGATWHGHKG
jgi:hypothetical protein